MATTCGLRRSALAEQPGVDVRVLVIDDASTDDSAQAAKQIAADDPRVDVLAHPVNKGHLATYNEGLLDWANGDYAVLLSADDLLTPGALTRACALLDAHPEVGFPTGTRCISGIQDRRLPVPRFVAGRCGQAGGGSSGGSARQTGASPRRRW